MKSMCRNIELTISSWQVGSPQEVVGILGAELVNKQKFTIRI